MISKERRKQTYEMMMLREFPLCRGGGRNMKRRRASIWNLICSWMVCHRSNLELLR